MMPKHNSLRIATALLLLMTAAQANAQTRFWVGGSGNWNDAVHWSTTANGIGGASIPRVQNSVVIGGDVATSITVNGAAWCADLFIDGGNAEVVINGSGSSDINIAGSWTAIGNVRWLQNGTVNLIKRHGGVVIDLKAIPIAANVVCAESGSWSMQSDFVLNNADLRLKKGTLITNGNMFAAHALVQERRDSGSLITNGGIVKVEVAPDRDLSRNYVEHANALLVVGNDVRPWGNNVGDQQRDIALCGTNVGQTPFTINASLISDYNGFGVSCRGDCDGTVTATVSGGIGPFTYSWLGGPNSATWTTACGGPQIVIVTDNGQGVSCAAQVSVTEPPPLGVIFFGQGTTPTCADVCNGTRTAVAVGGAGFPTYTWNGTVGGPSYNQLCAGTNTLNITDQNGCTFDTVFVFNLLPINPNLTTTEVSCFGVCDGTALVMPTGGTGSPIIFWGPGSISGQSTNNASGLCQGDYFVTITDVNGCDTTQNFTIIQPTPIEPNLVTFSATCFGICDGAATVNPGGAPGDFTFVWSPAPGGGQNTATASLLCAQQYSVTITNTASGCDSTITFDISSPPEITTAATVNDVSCAGECNGTISLVNAGGTGGFSYNWAPPILSTSANLTDLCAGNYTVTITDDAGCDTTMTFSVTEPQLLVATLASEEVSCIGVCDGTASVALVGGTSNYSFLWTPTAAGQGTPDVTGLCAGSYSVLVTDNNGCDTTISFTINEPLPLSATSAQTNVTCDGLCDGSAGVVVTGGTLDYTYLWTPEPGGAGQGTPNVTGLCAGVYSVLITDANGCELTIPFNILDAIPISVNLQLTAISCPGECDGTAGVVASGGLGDYTYAWAPDAGISGQGTPNVTGLCAMAYTVTVTDIIGCDTTIAFTVPAPPPIAITSVVTDVSCAGDCDGSVALTPSGGDGTYTFVWTPAISPSTGTVSNLCAGNYTVVISSGGCDATFNFTINEPPPFVIQTTSNDVSCSGVCDGTASASVSGAGGGFVYVWTPNVTGQGTPNATALCDGSYSLMITDANGCDTTLTFTINEPLPLTATPIQTNVTCGGACDGTASVVVADGTTDYTYLWSPNVTGQGTPNTTDLCAGIYSLLITDANGCELTVPFTILDAVPIASTLTVTPVSCPDVCDGAASVSATGGAGGFTHVWAPAAGIVGQGTPNVTGLCAINYTVTITDVGGCDTTIAFTVPAPQPINVPNVVTDATCAGDCNGSIALTPTGGNGTYTYVWTPPITPSTGSVSNLCAGTYSVAVSSGGCDTTLNFVINEPPSINATLVKTDIACSNVCSGAATVSATGGSGNLSYTWAPGSFNGQGTPNVVDLCPGNYTVTVADVTGCDTVITFTILDAQPLLSDLTLTLADCGGACNGTASAIVPTTLGTLSYLWGPGNIVGQGTQTASQLCSGTYTLTVSSTVGCDTTVQFVIGTPSGIVAVPSVTNVSCSNQCDGSISAPASGGTGALTYTWSPTPITGQGTATVTNLCAGTYTLVITDAIACDTTLVFEVGGPDPIIPDLTLSNETCFNGPNDGTMTVDPTGGTGNYTVVWSPQPTGGQGTYHATGLAPGVWCVTITDANGCDTTVCDLILPVQTLGIGVANIVGACANSCTGEATITHTGGYDPYSYQWTPAPTIGSDSDATAIGLCVGEYEVQIQDASGCDTTITITIPNNALIVANLNVIAETCSGPCTGSATIAPTGGQGVITANWQPDAGIVGQGTYSVSGLCAGTNYTVTLTDGTGCGTTIPFTVDPFTDIQGNIGLIPATCFNSCDGTATATPTGGTPNYTYAWVQQPNNTSATATGLCPGTYDLLITDALGCTHSESILILAPDTLHDNATISSITCGGACDGTIVLDPTGGDGTFAYMWSPPVAGQGTNTATDLCAGTYSVTVTDGLGCDSTFTYTLSEPPGLALSTASTLSQCSICAGTASVTIAGGTPGYVILWTDALGNDLGASDTIIDLCAGIYTVLVTDANSCTMQMSVAVDDADGEILSTMNGVTSCANACDGSVSVSYLCNAPNCSVVWTDAQGNDLNQPNDIATGLCIGTYFVQVTNGDGCVSIDTAYVTAPQPLTANISSVSVSCSGECDGTATVGVSGVVGPFTFTWTPAPPDPTEQGQPNVTGLCAGTYSILITYGAGCDTTVSVLILEPQPLMLAPVVTDVSCNGNCDGTIIPTPQGGNGSYSYFWEPAPPNGQGAPTASNLCPGDHIVTVTDQQGCSVTDTITVNEPQLLQVTATTTLTSCPACDGTASAVVTGGTQPFVFSWVLNGTVISTEQDPIDLCGGVYNLTVTDNNGCTAQLLVPIQDAAADILTTTDGQTNCANDCDGTVSVDFVCSVDPCVIVWYDPMGVPIANTPTVSNLCQGIYAVEVTNANGCTSIATAAVTPSTTLTINTTNTPPSCPGDCDASATVSASGGIPQYTYLWNDDNAQTTAQATGLCAGNYAVLISDASGCDTTVTVLIQDPLPITISGVVTDALCNADCNGVISSVIFGGSGVYTYAWSPGQPIGQGTGTISQLCPDTYSLTVADANGCSASQSWTLNEPSAILLTATSTLSECNLCNGTAEVEATGGTQPYSYLWTLSGVIYGTDSMASGLCAGLYTVTVTDSNGCEDTLLVPVNDLSGEVLSASGDTTSCANACDGTATVDFVCSDPACSIAWYDAGGNDLMLNTNTITGLCAVTYFVQVINATGCISLDTAIVSAPPDLVPNLSTTAVGCIGDCDGTATIAPTGGSGQFSYNWTPAPIGQGTSQVTQLCEGSIDVEVTDIVTGCVSMFTAMILAPDTITATITTSNPTCNGVCDGTITIASMGGNGGYSYTWSDPSIPDTNSVSGLCAGTYQVIIVDQNGCDASYTITLNDPPLLLVTLNVSNSVCSGDCSGSVTATISGGLPSFTTVWTDDNGTIIDQNTNTLNGLCAGNYEFKVTDFGGCIITMPFSITESASIVPGISVTNESCIAPCDGTATLNPSGGIGPLTFLWGPGTIVGQGTNAVTALCPGNYTVIITDSLGCDTTVSFTILTYAPIEPNAIQQDVLCNGNCDGSIVLSPTGGSGVYTYDWSAPNGPIENEATALCQGSITVTINDGTVCDHTVTYVISEPSALNIAIDNTTPASCLNSADGVINTTVSGGTGQPLIQWQGPNNFNSTLEDITGLLSGTYIISVTDANNCNTSATVIVDALSPVNANAGPDMNFCSGISVILDGSASSGATTFIWTNAQGTQVGNAAVVDVGSLGAGTYTFTLTVADGVCTATDDVTIIVLAAPVADAGPDHSIFLNGSVTLGGNPTALSGSTIVWSPDSVLTSGSAANPDADPSSTTWFTVTVTSPDGCVSIDSVLITVQPGIVFPTGITPNGDGYNDTWIIDFVDNFPNIEVEIYNRWGEMLFRSVGYRTPWDGKYSGDFVPIGTYYYVIDLKDPMYPEAYTGPLTVIR